MPLRPGNGGKAGGPIGGPRSAELGSGFHARTLEQNREDGEKGGQANGGVAKSTGQYTAKAWAVWRCPEGCGPWATAVMETARAQRSYGQRLYCGAKGCGKTYTYSQCEIHSLHASLQAAKEHV